MSFELRVHQDFKLQLLQPFHLDIPQTTQTLTLSLQLAIQEQEPSIFRSKLRF
jgi:hypothetical protein